jgi:hypothetical protein
MRWRARSDANHAELAACLKAVMPCVNAKWPADYLCLHPRLGLLLVDIKAPGKRKERTETQAKLEREGWPIRFVETPEDVTDLAQEGAEG